MSPFIISHTCCNRYGSANDSMPIAVSDISCSASYFWHFMRCDVDYGNLDEDCSHRQDVAVFCSKILCTSVFI